jgi:hypothetical protein
VLLRELREGPIRTSTLRALMELCSPRDQRAELHVLRQIVSTFDSAVTAATDPAFHSGLWRGRTLLDAIGPATSPEALRVLGMLWEYARVIPRYRRGLAAFGVAERDRITRITVGPVAEAYAQAARMLGATDVPVYVTRNNGAPARALPTHPPAVQAGRGVALEATALLYTMAHALWLADPPHVIGGVLGREDAVDLLEAARVAFVPADATRAPMPSVKELAAALWQAVPMREQKQIADTLRAQREGLAYPQVRARVRAGAARAALLSSGGLAAALRLLPVMEAELAGVDLSTEQAFEHACELSRALADSIRCALSAHYLDALQHVL